MNADGWLKMLEYIDAVSAKADRTRRRLEAVDVDLERLGLCHNHLRKKHNTLVRVVHGAVKRGPLKTGRHASR